MLNRKTIEFGSWRYFIIIIFIGNHSMLVRCVCVLMTCAGKSAGPLDGSCAKSCSVLRTYLPPSFTEFIIEVLSASITTRSLLTHPPPPHNIQPPQITLNTKLSLNPNPLLIYSNLTNNITLSAEIIGGRNWSCTLQFSSFHISSAFLSSAYRRNSTFTRTAAWRLAPLHIRLTWTPDSLGQRRRLSFIQNPQILPTASRRSPKATCSTTWYPSPYPPVLAFSPESASHR